MSNSEMTVIEVNGVKLEVDLRSARRIENMRIGDRVKLLNTSTYGGSKVHPGVVIGFEPFRSLPTILVAYIDQDWTNASVKTVAINANQKDWELVVAVDPDFSVDRSAIVNLFDRQIAAKQREIEVIKEQRQYFETNFRAFWTRAEEEALPPAPESVDF